MSLTRQSWVIVLLLVVETMGFAFIAPVFTPLLLKSHILSNSDSEMHRILILGLLNAVYPFCMFVATPFLGMLSDQFGRKNIFLFSLIGTCLGYLVTGIGVFTHSIWLAVLGRALDGMTAGSVPIAQATMSDVSKGLQSKVRLMGLTVLGFAGGQTIGPMLSGVLSDSHLSHWFGYQLPFYVVAVLSLFNIVLLCWGFKETHQAPAQHIKVMPALRGHYLSLFRSPILLWLGLALLCHQMAISLYMQSMPVILTEAVHFTGLDISYWAATAGVVMAISVFVILPLLSRIIRVPFLMVGLFACQTLGMLLSWLMPSVTTFWIVVALIIFGTSQSYALFLTVFSQCGDDKSQGWLMGTTAAIVALSWAVTAVLSGVLPLAGGIYLPEIVAVGLSLAGLLLLFSWFCCGGNRRQVA